MQKGDPVTIGYDGRTVDGVIELISENQRSVAIKFDAMLGGYVGMMPVLMDDSGTYRDLIKSEPVTLTPKADT